MNTLPAHLLLATVAGLVASPMSLPALDAPVPSGAALVALAATEPVIDAPAPFLWDNHTGRPAGGEADRFELTDPSLAHDLSSWYHLSYVAGGQRLRVFEHNPATTRGADSDIAKSQNVAWHVAAGLLGTARGLAQPGEIPEWARPRTGNSDGPSAGLIFALASLDVLTPGPLAANLRVAGTGAIGSDGVVTAVRMVDAKLAAARLAGVDVFFAPEIPPGPDGATRVVSHLGTPTPDRAIGDWLNTAAYERAGRAASMQPGTLALVEVDDIRQAVAWLCGRTQRPGTCAVAHMAAAVPLRAARPYHADTAPRSTHDEPLI